MIAQRTSLSSDDAEFEASADGADAGNALRTKHSIYPNDELSIKSREYWKEVFWPTLEDPRDGDDRVGWPLIFLTGFQHMIIILFSHAFMPMFVFSIPGVLREEDGDLEQQQNFLLSSSIFMAGLATLFQTFKMGPIGSQLLIIMGNNYAFIGVAIMSGMLGGPGLIFGMGMASAPLELLITYLPIRAIRYIFPPVVIGTVIALIGGSAIGNFVGGWAGDGSKESMGLGFFTIGLMALLLRWGSPLVKNGAFIIAIIGAFALAGILGVVDRSKMDNASWFTYPEPLKYGLAFEPSHYLAWIIAVVVSTVESIGDIATTCELSKKPIDGIAFSNRIRGGLNADTFGSFISGLFCTFPNTSYSSTQGVIKITGVSDRRVGTVAGLMFIVLGFIGKFAGFLRSIPEPIMNSILLFLLMLLVTIGFQLIAKDDLSSQRTQFIVATSLGIGFGTHVQTTPTIEHYVGYNSGMTPTANVIMSSGLAFGSLTVIILNIILPKVQRSLMDDLRMLRDCVLCRKKKRVYNESVQINEVDHGSTGDSSTSTKSSE